MPANLHEFWSHRETLSIKSGLITCSSRIIVPSCMREMLNYIHKGHQGKEHYLLRTRNTVFWPKITYDIQQLIDKCMICQEFGKSQPITGTTPISMADHSDRPVLLEKNGIPDGCRFIFQVHSSQETIQFHVYSSLQRVVYDCY